MSRTPTGILRFSRLSIFLANLCASGTPRLRMPTNASLARSSVVSRISCARRTSVRSVSEALMSWDFSRVASIEGKRSKSSTPAAPRCARSNGSVSLQTAPNIFRQFLDVLRFFQGPYRNHIPVVLFEIRLQFPRQLHQFRRVLKVLLVVGFENLLLLRLAVWQLHFIFIRRRRKARRPLRNLRQHREHRGNKEERVLHHLQ